MLTQVRFRMLVAIGWVALTLAAAAAARAAKKSGGKTRGGKS